MVFVSLPKAWRFRASSRFTPGPASGGGAAAGAAGAETPRRALGPRVPRALPALPLPAAGARAGGAVPGQRLCGAEERGAAATKACPRQGRAGRSAFGLLNDGLVVDAFWSIPLLPGGPAGVTRWGTAWVTPFPVSPVSLAGPSDCGVHVLFCARSKSPRLSDVILTALRDQKAQSSSCALAGP